MKIRIYYQDTDCGGVVYYANYLVYFERARTEWLSELGFSVRDMMKDNLYFVVSRAETDYLKPAAYGDTLDVSVKVVKLSRASMDLAYEVKKESTTVVKGFTRLVAVDSSMRVRPLPPAMREKLSSLSA